ncbi:uncharacterized protein BX663DRAFT_513330 [Cokeromyces recurvatus]|uniref:uncharacterized protein n=1 Tax=Cokeromyces recurvatus TaxID=90255 RepID=UPI00221FBA91|nr:uncharacterized protein BX663DRAFT_513330 [Cokeromyces recurvatus]KAI7901573.1 hypothetical protein BX663DRAFT_513330 [Cokeromyces recurvatus]
MTMLMTENNSRSLEYELILSESKKRRFQENRDNKEENTIASIKINPATQQLNRYNMVAPDFNCTAILNNEINRLQLSTLFAKYKAVVLFFYNYDLTSIACKDLTLINHYFERLQSLNTMPLAMSTNTEITQSILDFIPSYPLVADMTCSVSRHFNVLHPETGLIQRAAFVIDNTRQVRFSFLLDDNRISHSMDTICTILRTF